MKTIGLIFPHQLFLDNPVLKHADEVYLIEDSLFFGDTHNPLKFHKQKLVLHRASMQAYKDELASVANIKVHYIEYEPKKNIVNILKGISLDIKSIVCVDPTDYLLERRIRRVFPDLVFLDSPLFINSKDDNIKYLKEGKLFMQEFYKFQRKRLNILMDASGPVGGRWSYDDENRKKIPKSHYLEIPADSKHNKNKYVDEAIAYVQKKFPSNYGSLETFSYAINRKQALQVLEDFCSERLHLFGDYEDAIVKDRNQLYHSMLSPYLNIGLISPIEVVEKVIAYAKKNNISINNTEGIVRQIIGWREFIRMTYEEHGVLMRTENQWNHTRELGQKWYDGTTGIDPVDSTIRKTINSAYAHHIERLMVMGNFMFLCEIDPKQVYNWFMEMYIDAYDWVMVPNVYGMTQSTQKGLMTTKPYISGSNYIKKMSDYAAGPWGDIWDALYWNMIINNIDELTENGRMHFVTARAQKFSKEQKENYAEKAEEFYRSL